jgi:hypothetical protein
MFRRPITILLLSALTYDCLFLQPFGFRTQNAAPSLCFDTEGAYATEAINPFLIISDHDPVVGRDPGFSLRRRAWSLRPVALGLTIVVGLAAIIPSIAQTRPSQVLPSVVQESERDKAWDRFFSGAWTNFFQVSRSHGSNMPQLLESMQKEAASLGDPKLDQVIRLLAEALSSPQFSRYSELDKAIIQAWADFLASHPGVNGLAGELQGRVIPGMPVVFTSVIFRIEREQILEEPAGHRARLIYGRRLDGNKDWRDAGGVTVAEKGMIYVDNTSIDEETDNIQAALDGKSFVLKIGNRQIISPPLTRWVRQQFAGKSKAQIRSIVERMIVTHELFHWAEYVFNVGFHFRKPWNRANGSTRILDRMGEDGPYLGTPALEDLPGYSLIHLLPGFFYADSELHTTAYYVINRLASRLHLAQIPESDDGHGAVDRFLQMAGKQVLRGAAKKAYGQDASGKALDLVQQLLRKVSASPAGAQAMILIGPFGRASFGHQGLLPSSHLLLQAS